MIIALYIAYISLYLPIQQKKIKKGFNFIFQKKN